MESWQRPDNQAAKVEELKQKLDRGEQLLPREKDELRAWAQGSLPESEKAAFMEKLYGKRE